MKKILTYYNFVIVSLIVLAGFFDAQTPTQLLNALPLVPLVIYFGIFVLPRQRRAIIIPKKAKPAPVLPKPVKTTEIKSPEVEGEIVEEGKEGVDSNRRIFLKLIGSAGLSVFFFALFTKKAEAAFFGSVPGPGTLKIKDTAGNPIDPSEKQPTDGYNITKIDDSSSPVYYGFVNKEGAWFIMQEEEGTYLYFKGSSGFSDSWEIKGSLEYDTFDEIF